MNIANLTEGMEIKNYTQLCNLLGEDIKTGKSKIYQLEDWERYFEFKKQGHKFIVGKIYDEPKAKKVDRAVYVRFIELLLMYELSTKEGYTCHYTKTNLFFLLGMINQYYFKNNRWLVNNKISAIPSWQINQFYEKSSKKLTNILFSALNSMKSRRLLSDYEELRIICRGEEQRVANDEEREQILTVERDALLEMGYEKVFNIPYTRINEYYENINAKLKEAYGWDSVYKEYKLIFNSKQIADDIPTVKDELIAAIRKNQLELNDKILEAMYKQAESLYAKNCEEYKESFDKHYEHWSWGAPPKIDYDNRIKLPGVFDYRADYIENQKDLVDIFLSIQ